MSMIDQLRGVTTATIALQLLKRGLRAVAMRGPMPLVAGPGIRLVGPAFTLRYVPMREDLSTPEKLGRADNAGRRAMEETPPGAVLVIDARGETGCGVMGDILALRLKMRGVAGIVTDGAVRDAEGLAAIGLPCWCAGAAAPASIGGHYAADMGAVIGCGGVAVVPGDIVVADGDGAVVIPQALAGEVARDGAEQERLERFIHRRIAGGRPLPGNYPPNEETLAAYRAWLAAGEPDNLA